MPLKDVVRFGFKEVQGSTQALAARDLNQVGGNVTVDNCNASILVLVVATVGSGTCMITNRKVSSNVQNMIFFENRSV